MAFSNIHVLLAFGAAALTVALVIGTAGSMTVGMSRLRLIVKTTCRAVVITGIVLGTGMLGWGLAAPDETLMYLSALPFVFAVFASDFMRRNGL